MRLERAIAFIAGVGSAMDVVVVGIKVVGVLERAFEGSDP